MFRARVNWDAEIDTIFTLLSTGITRREIGKKYNVSRQQICNIISKYKLKERGLPLGANARAMQHAKEVEDLKLSKYGISVKRKRALKECSLSSFDKLCYLKFLRKKHNCNRKGIPFTLTFDLIQFPQTCPILDIPLNYGKQIQSYADDLPVFDRIDSTKGYIDGNVHIISQRANRIKNDSTVEELRKIYEYIKKISSQD